MKAKSEIRLKEESFKKTLSNFWVWLGIWLISYILFVLMPVQYNESGYGWDAWQGINLFKTFFSYISALALLIAIILFGISILKRIQKSSMSDYWKISFTIVGIVLLILYGFYYVKDIPRAVFDDKKSEDELDLGLDNKKSEAQLEIERAERYTQYLEEKGYEVIGTISFLEVNKSYSLASVDMKSLGNRESQVSDGLTYLSVAYPNASLYTIRILSPQDTCIYELRGDIYRAYIREFREWEEILPSNLTTKEEIQKYRDYVSSGDMKKLNDYVQYQTTYGRCS